MGRSIFSEARERALDFDELAARIVRGAQLGGEGEGEARRIIVRLLANAFDALARHAHRRRRYRHSAAVRRAAGSRDDHPGPPACHKQEVAWSF